MILEVSLERFADKSRYYPKNDLAKTLLLFVRQLSFTEKQLFDLSKHFEIVLGMDKNGDNIFFKGEKK